LLNVDICSPVVLTDYNTQEWIDAWLLAQALCYVLHNTLRYAAFAETQYLLTNLQ